MGQDIEYSVTVSCGLIQFHPDTPKQMRPSLGLAYLHPLLGHLPGLDAAHGAQHIHRLKGETRMLAGNAAGASVIDRA
jgi:hypothetical protein